MDDIIISENCKKAVSLDISIKTHARSAQEHLFEVCKGLKEMRDGKLYKELGYQNFEDYTENEVGIKRRQAYKYITIAETFDSDFVHPGAQIGTSKLYLLTKLDEEQRTELMENSNIEDMSKRELEAKIKEIKALQSKVDTLSTENAAITQQKKALAKKLDEANEEKGALSDRIEQLESRPVDVAVADNSHEIENMRKAMIKCDREWSARCDKLQEESFAESRKHIQEVSRIKAEYEQKIAEISKIEPTTVVDDKAIFKAYLSTAIDSAKRLLDFIKSQESSENHEFYCDKTQDFFKKIGQEIQNDKV